MATASGQVDFGSRASHEDYLDILKSRSPDPMPEILDYLLRDALNLAMSNPDNHGRNTALTIARDGSATLTPLFDFCPMGLDASGIRRATTWACMADVPGGDENPDWDVVCRRAAEGVVEADVLRGALASKADDIARLPSLAREMGMHAAAVDAAMGRCGEIAESIRT